MPPSGATCTLIAVSGVGAGPATTAAAWAGSNSAPWQANQQALRCVVADLAAGVGADGVKRNDTPSRQLHRHRWVAALGVIECDAALGVQVRDGADARSRWRCGDGW